MFQLLAWQHPNAISIVWRSDAWSTGVHGETWRASFLYGAWIEYYEDLAYLAAVFAGR